MSNSLAIAAVTETLRKLLDDGINMDPNIDPNSDGKLAGTAVTVRPVDRARTNMNGLQLNLFLYHTVVNTAWRNQDMPRQVKAGETGRPPLPLNLLYLITAYGPEDDEVLAHRLLGRAMSLLHDSPVLDPVMIQNALANNDLHQQIEHIRITPQPMNLEELSKLWAAFQTQYRISAAYLVTVVLIESTLAPRSPLPVLRRGPEDRGPTAFAEPWPALNSLYGIWNLPIQPPPVQGSATQAVRPLVDQPIARLGETLVLRGQNLGPEQAVARLSHPLVDQPIDLPLQAGDQPQELKVLLPPADPHASPGVLQAWPCGFYTLSLVTQRGDFTWTTNAVPFLLAPAISLQPQTAAHGPLTLTVICRPRLRPEQEKRTCLLFGSRQVLPATVDTPTDNPGDEDQPTTLTFQLTLGSDEVAVYTVRLRVDGVDSLPFAVEAQKGTLIFDPAQQVTIT
jgi:hypothetical protein